MLISYHFTQMPLCFLELQIKVKQIYVCDTVCDFDGSCKKRCGLRGRIGGVSGRLVRL